MKTQKIMNSYQQVTKLALITLVNDHFEIHFESFYRFFGIFTDNLQSVLFVDNCFVIRIAYSYITSQNYEK